MSELITKQPRADFRWSLLSTVSALALLTSVAIAEDVQAREDGGPTVWVEIGTQLERIDGAQSPFTAPFLLQNPVPGPFTPVSPIDAQRPPRYSIGGEGRILFTPENSDWVLSAAVRYGRASGKKHVHQQTVDPDRKKYITPDQYFNRKFYLGRFADSKVKQRESHLLVDFQVGKDVGLGLFGKSGQSTLGLGLRYAQFVSKTSVDLAARPTFESYKIGFKYYYRFHAYNLDAQSARSFHGIGPSLSWEGSTRLAGNSDAAEFNFDWGVNAAVLFGRQKMKASHETLDRYFKQLEYNHPLPSIGASHYNVFSHKSGQPSRRKSVTVPNLGAFAGLSVKFPNAKVSLGYRADFFFGAMDGGIDVRRSDDRYFRGPFAKLSIGLGD